MDEDDFTKQRALDAAAAVAVAAAAAAQHNRDVMSSSSALPNTHGNQEQIKSHETGSDGRIRPVENGLDSLQNYTQHVNGSESILQDNSREEDGLTRRLDDSNTSTTNHDESPYMTETVQQDENGKASATTKVTKPRKAKKPTVHHTKRRKINTCLPCKRRKVKCDREKPYCNQCKKHDFPMSECTWSVSSMDPSIVKAGDTSPLLNSNTSSNATAASATNLNNTLADNSMSDSAAVSAAQWLDMSNAPWANFTSSPAEQTIQALQNRIISLEATIEELRNEKNASNTTADAKEEKLTTEQ